MGKFKSVHVQWKWVAVTIGVMFVVPFLVVEFAPECAGMLLCMLLFLVVNPTYFIVLGVLSGRNLKAFWFLPVIASFVFFLGAWLLFDNISDFVYYAVMYLGIGVVAMLAAYCFGRNKNRI